MVRSQCSERTFYRFVDEEGKLIGSSCRHDEHLHKTASSYCAPLSVLLLLRIKPCWHVSAAQAGVTHLLVAAVLQDELAPERGLLVSSLLDRLHPDNAT